MNATEIDHTQTASAELLLSLIVPPNLVDPLVDWLLERQAVSGFIRLPVNGHGGAEHSMTEAEKVAGYRKGWMLQTHMSEENASDVLNRLKQDFKGSDIHYWITPILAGGHLV